MTAWPDRAVVLAIHDEQLSEHGGSPGIRDQGLLDSALARLLNLERYGSPDLFALAAAYASGIVRNHPFIDGNEGVSLVATALFLDLNGYALDASDVDCVTQWTALASGLVPEAEMAEWLRAHCQPTR